MGGVQDDTSGDIRYRVILSSRARRDLDKFLGVTYLRLRKAIDLLRDDPRPPGCVKMVGTASEWRIRIGAYRIRYEIDDVVQEITVLRVAHRREIYRS